MSADNTDQVTVTNQGEDKSPGIDVSIVNEEQELIGSLDPATLDPNLSYRWVHDSAQKIARRKSRGYRFVRKSEDGVKTLYTEGQDGADDILRHGDTVLMCIPKEKKEEMDEQIRRITKSRLSAPKGQFRKKAGKHGVNVDTSDKGPE